MMKNILVLIALVLSGCSSVGRVLPINGDTYSVTTSGHYSSWSTLKQNSIQRARIFCEEQKKQMSLVGWDTNGIRGWTPQEAELTFNCLTQPPRE